jgi:hypothetical protein
VPLVTNSVPGDEVHHLVVGVVVVVDLDAVPINSWGEKQQMHILVTVSSLTNSIPSSLHTT